MDSTLIVAIAAVFIVSVIFSMFGQGGGSVYTPILFLLGYATLTFDLNLTCPQSHHGAVRIDCLLPVKPCGCPVCALVRAGHLHRGVSRRDGRRVYRPRAPDVAVCHIPCRSPGAG